jgi:predicted kinase
MNRKRVKPSLSTEDPTAMAVRHREIIDALTKDIPPAKEVGQQQKVLIIAGPFAGGKSEILEHMDTKNMVVIDLDVIRKMLSKDYDPTNQQDIQREREESWKVSDLLAIESIKQGKSIVMQTALHRRSRWLKDPTITFANENNIPIEICMILRPVTDCINRNIHRDRSVTMADQFESMNGMDVLIKFVQKYKMVKSVSLIDFYPLIKNTHLLSPIAFQYQYMKLLEYANGRPELFKIHTSINDLAILPE